MAAVPSRAEPPRWRAREGRRPHQDGPAGAPTPSGDGRYRHGCAGRRPSLKGEPPGTCQPENELPRRLSPEGKPPGVREAPSRPRALAWRVPDVVAGAPIKLAGMREAPSRAAWARRVLDVVARCTRWTSVMRRGVSGWPARVLRVFLSTSVAGVSRRTAPRGAGVNVHGRVAPADERIGPRCPGLRRRRPRWGRRDGGGPVAPGKRGDVGTMIGPRWPDAGQAVCGRVTRKVDVTKAWMRRTSSASRTMMAARESTAARNSDTSHLSGTNRLLRKSGARTSQNGVVKVTVR